MKYIQILFFATFLINAYSFQIPCQVQTLQKDIIGLPCSNLKEAETQELKYLNQYIDTNSIKKLSFSGWWVSKALVNSNENQIFIIGEKEIAANQQTRALYVKLCCNFGLYLQQSKYPTENNNPIYSTSTDVNLFADKWYFLIGSINLNAQYISLYFNCEASNQFQFKVTSSLSMYTSFNSQMIISYGLINTVYNFNGGCGKAYNVKLYSDFSFSSLTEINPYQFMKSEAKINIQYSMIGGKGEKSFIVDESGNNNHAQVLGNSIIDPQWNTQNEGVRFIMNNQLALPVIDLLTGDLFISFWINIHQNSNFIIMQINEINNQNQFLIISGIFDQLLGIQKIQFQFLKTNFYNISNPTTFDKLTWYLVLLSCNNYQGLFKYKCNATTSINAQSTEIFQFSTFNLTQNNFQIYLGGDQINQGLSFSLKQLLISDGSRFNLKDASTNCIQNCEIYLACQQCLFCSSGYLINQATGQCILISSCTQQDPDIPYCRDTKVFCTSELKIAPNCNTCLNNQYSMTSDNSCGECGYNCASCSSSNLNQCLTCDSSRNTDAPSCTCQAPFYQDDGKQGKCLSVATNIMPNKVTYLKLTLLTLTQNSCGNNIVPTDNKFTYSDLGWNDLFTNGGSKFSFSLWFSITSITSYNTLFMLSYGTAALNKQFVYISNMDTSTLNIGSESPTLSIGKTISNLLKNQWMWGFFSYDFVNMEISWVVYKSYDMLWMNNYASSVYSNIPTDSTMYFGTRAPNSLNGCCCNLLGKYQKDLFFYQRITARGLNYNLLIMKQMMKLLPDYAYLLFSQPSDNDFSLQQQTFLDLFNNNGNANLGKTSYVEDNYDPKLHWYNGFIFFQKNIMTIPSFVFDSYLIHYWWIKSIVDINFYTFLRINTAEQNMMSIQHIANKVLNNYKLLICVLKYCSSIQNARPMKLQQWNFVAVSIWNSISTEIYIQTYVNSQNDIFSFPIYQMQVYGSSTDITTIGSVNNSNSDPFYIKNFTVNQGGSLFDIEMGANGTVPHCLLTSVRSNRSQTQYAYCILCESGYYVDKDGNCIQGQQFCNLEWSNCIPKCRSGYYSDPLTKLCTIKCNGSNYYLDNITQSCVTQCPVNYYGEAAIGKCTQQCNPPLFGDLNLRICVQICPINFYGYDLQRTCVSSCPAGVFADPITRKCTCECSTGLFASQSQNLCVTDCPNGRFADIPSKSCSIVCSYGYLADSTTNQCVLICPNGYFGDLILRICVQNCSSGYYKEINQRKCLQQCPQGQYADQLTLYCEVNCTGNQYADPISGFCSLYCTNPLYADNLQWKCVEKCSAIQLANHLDKTCSNSCPTSYYKDYINNLCVTQCPSQFYGDPISKNCSELCQTGYFADPLTSLCSLSCSNQYFADSTTRKCSLYCSNGFYADQTTKTCATSCPAGYNTDSINNKCISTCTNQEFTNPLTNQCSNTCPSNYYADINSHTCKLYDTSCFKLYCIHPQNRICVNIGSEIGLDGRNKKTYVCVEINQAVGVDECAVASPINYYCIDQILNQYGISQCLIQINRVNNTDFCQCEIFQCRKQIMFNITRQGYQCFNFSKQQLLIGKEKKSELCLNENQTSTYGAERCINQYCIEQDTFTCVQMTILNQSRIGRISTNHSCISKNKKEDIDSCIEGTDYCLDSDNQKSQCIFLLNRVNIIQNKCECQQLFCIEYNFQNLSYYCAQLNESIPTRIGREKISQYCLPENVIGQIGQGADSCVSGYCIDPLSKACVKLSKLGYQGRKESNHYCVKINEAVGVDQCAQGAYCIDIIQQPSQCIDLDFPSTCYIGYEKDTQTCDYAGTTGSKLKGMSYCKASYCIQNSTNLQQQELLTCELLDFETRVAKDSFSFCRQSGIPNMIECGPGYCLEQLTKACLKIEGLIYGKDLKTNICIKDITKGVQKISECLNGYCKMTSEQDQLQYCIKLNQYNNALIGKEKLTHNCMKNQEQTLFGILKCANTYCVSEVSAKAFQCVNQVQI